MDFLVFCMESGRKQRPASALARLLCGGWCPNFRGLRFRSSEAIATTPYPPSCRLGALAAWYWARHWARGIPTIPPQDPYLRNQERRRGRRVPDKHRADKAAEPLSDEINARVSGACLRDLRTRWPVNTRIESCTYLLRSPGVFSCVADNAEI